MGLLVDSLGFGGVADIDVLLVIYSKFQFQISKNFLCHLSMAYKRKLAGRSLLRLETLDERIGFAKCSRKFLRENCFSGPPEVSKTRSASMVFKFSALSSVANYFGYHKRISHEMRISDFTNHGCLQESVSCSVF